MHNSFLQKVVLTMILALVASGFIQFYKYFLQDDQPLEKIGPKIPQTQLPR